jgi:hypothetical protein
MNKILIIVIVIIILIVLGVIGYIIYRLYRSRKPPPNPSTTLNLSTPSRIYISNRCLVNTDGINLKFDDCSNIINKTAEWVLLNNGQLIDNFFSDIKGKFCVAPSMNDNVTVVNTLCWNGKSSNPNWIISNPTWTIKDNKLVYSNGLCLGSNSSHEAILTSCHNAPILSNSPIT